jgi:hypothetical protein
MTDLGSQLLSGLAGKAEVNTGLHAGIGVYVCGLAKAAKAAGAARYQSCWRGHGKRGIIAQDSRKHGSTGIA